MNITSLLFESANQTPHKIAIRHAEDHITYADLSQSIKRLSNFLIKKGVQQGDRVVIFSDKSIDFSALLLATLCIGAVYVPIDILYSIEHANNIIKDAEPIIIFCTSIYFEEITKLNHCEHIIDIDHFNDEASSDDFTPIHAEMACILYTSGSTGNPKGVCLSHQNIFHFSQWCIQQFQLKSDFHFANHAPFTFDLSLFDIFCSLSIGATLHLLSYPFNTLPNLVLDYLIHHKITVWYSVPYFLQLLSLHEKFNAENCHSLKFIFYAGESYPTRQLKRLREKFEKTHIYNFYGPTETNVCSYYQVPEIVTIEHAEMPIGMPTCDTILTVTPEENELCVQGKTVAIGYWKKDAFNGYFKTGDRVAINANNEFLFCARISNAIIFNEEKVFPEMIESVLNSHPYIKCSVLFYALSSDANPGRFLIVIQSEEGKSDLLSKEQIKTFLYQFNYENYCDDIILTKKIIRTRNGKMNRDEKSLLTYLKIKEQHDKHH